MLINIELIGVILRGNWIRFYFFRDEEYVVNLKFSLINFWMVFLVFILYLIILTTEMRMKLSLNFLLITLIFIIMVRDIVVFFLLYEIIFILIIFVILLLGYSYERLIAAFLIIFYSFLFSRPLLIIVLLFDHRFLIKSWLVYSNIINYFFIGSFIVKFPIFGFHYWLPIAHVEASTIGSILLAGILLKIGTVGVYYRVIYLNFCVKFHWLSWRVVVTIIIIVVLSDIKIIIAYSSVAHITLVFYILNIGYDVGIKGAVLIMFYHGFLSPLIFWLVGSLAWWKTRSLIVVKIITFSYLFILIVFSLRILNIGFPPFMGFLREILILKSVINNIYVLRILIFSVLFRCYYNVYLFWCFNGVIGLVFKRNFFLLDVYLFLGFILILNF